MKRFYFQFRISLLTLALGLSSVSFVNWLVDYSSEIPVHLPKVESVSPIVVFPMEGKFINHGCLDGSCAGDGGGCCGWEGVYRKTRNPIKFKKK